MAQNLHRVTITGRLFRNAELKYGADGSPYLRFSVAVNRSKKIDGQWQNITDTYQCIRFGKLAEAQAPHALKGRVMIVSGECEPGFYVGRDGTTHAFTSVTADYTEIIDAVKSQNAGNYQQRQSAPAQPQAANEPTEDNSFYDNTGFDPTPVNPDEPNF